MSKKKIVYIISDIDKALAFEWTAVRLRDKFDLCFILLEKDESKFSFFLKNQSVRYYEISDKQYPSRLRKWIRLLLILMKEKPKTIHTHLWNANILGLSAAWLLRIKQRVFTRHHATTHYREFPSGRKWDVLCNRLATDIVAISRNIEKILTNWDKADPDKIHLIHHGFDFDYFKLVEINRVKTLRTKYNILSHDFPVVGVISRYMQWKGVQHIIQAFQKIREQYPTAKLLLANAQGNYQEPIKSLLSTLPTGSFVEIIFEEDLAALYQLFNVFVHVPVDSYVEAFGQTYVEALASGIPSIFTLSGVAPEFIVNEENALVVPFRDSESIYQALLRILNDVELRNRLMASGRQSAKQFPLSKMTEQLSQLYDN